MASFPMVVAVVVSSSLPGIRFVAVYDAEDMGLSLIAWAVPRGDDLIVALLVEAAVLWARQWASEVVLDGTTAPYALQPRLVR